MFMLRTHRIGKETWNYTREIVQKADPDFSRLSNTKLGSKLSQLRSPNDVMDFIGASGLLTSFLLTNLVVRFTPLHSEMIIWMMAIDEMIPDLKMTKGLLQRVVPRGKILIECNLGKGWNTFRTQKRCWQKPVSAHPRSSISTSTVLLRWFLERRNDWPKALLPNCQKSISVHPWSFISTWIVRLRWFLERRVDEC